MNDMDDYTLQKLQTWLSFRELSLAEIKTRFAPSDAQIHPKSNVSYAGLSSLTQVGDFESSPGLFYFRGEQFVLFFVDQTNEELDDMQLTVLLDYLGKPEDIIRSRSGKRHKLYIYPKHGLAFAGENETIAFLEIFPPITLNDYKVQFYVEPEEFIR